MINGREAEKSPERLELVPPVDIYDTDEAVVVLADLPGVAAGNLSVNVDRGSLTIRGRREEASEPGQRYFQEFRVGDYVRAFSLGEDVDASNIEAELRDGVLRLTLPKGPERKVRKIQVKAG